MIVDVERSPFDSRVAMFLYQLVVHELPAKKVGDLMRSLTEDESLRYADPYHVAYANELAGILLEDPLFTPESSDG